VGRHAGGWLLRLSTMLRRQPNPRPSGEFPPFSIGHAGTGRPEIYYTVAIAELTGQLAGRFTNSAKAFAEL